MHVGIAECKNAAWDAFQHDYMENGMDALMNERPRSFATCKVVWARWIKVDNGAVGENATHGSAYEWVSMFPVARGQPRAG